MRKTLSFFIIFSLVMGVLFFCFQENALAINSSTQLTLQNGNDSIQFSNNNSSWKLVGCNTDLPSINLPKGQKLSMTSTNKQNSIGEKNKAIKSQINESPIKDQIPQKKPDNIKSFIHQGQNKLYSIAQADVVPSAALSSVTPLATSTNTPPVANLAYMIMNPSSIINGNITTQTQIAWLWSYNGTNYTYDPDGDAITDMSIGGIPNSSIIGTLQGGIGFVTQFTTAGQYTMTFKCKDSNGLWSNTWSINITVEPADGNIRPICNVTYSPVDGDLNTLFVFNWSSSTDENPGDTFTNIGVQVYKDGQTYDTSKYTTQLASQELGIKFSEYGEYQIALRIMDNHNSWSNWVYATVKVTTDPSISRSRDGKYVLTKNITTGQLNINGNPVNLSWYREWMFSDQGNYNARTHDVSAIDSTVILDAGYGVYNSTHTGTINHAFVLQVQKVAYNYWYSIYINGGPLTMINIDPIGHITPRITHTDPIFQDPEIYLIINADTGKVVDMYSALNYYYHENLETCSFNEE